MTSKKRPQTTLLSIYQFETPSNFLSKSWLTSENALSFYAAGAVNFTVPKNQPDILAEGLSFPAIPIGPRSGRIFAEEINVTIP